MPLVQTRGAASAQGFGEFAQAAVAANYIEDVFSTYLYNGNSSTQNIVNGIDLAGKGGLVWGKSRNNSSGNNNHYLEDTVRGPSQFLFSNLTNAQNYSPTEGISTFNADGFSLLGGGRMNSTGDNMVSWTFREQPKFFDIVTYTGDGSAPRNISHSLNSSPGFIVIKRTNSTGDWWAWHRSIANKNIYLNYTDAADSGTNPMISAVSSTNFTLATNQNATMNINGATYVAYLFAHDAGGFGLTGTDNVISCGSFTTDGSGNATVNLGYEPQWILYKPSSSAGEWELSDTMRGWSNTSIRRFYANTSDSEQTYTANTPNTPNATGFQFTGLLNASSTYIYIAIRRGPMAVPTSGTSVYNAVARTGTGAATTITGVGFVPDLAISKSLTTVDVGAAFDDRLRGATKDLRPNTTASEATVTTGLTSFNMDGISVGAMTASPQTWNWSGEPYINYFFQRRPFYFDEVCYLGTGANTTQAHNLGVVPELMIVKRRTGAATSGSVYSATIGNTQQLELFSTTGNSAAFTDTTQWNSTTPTSSVFTVGTNDRVNASGSDYVAWLFATCAGVSKVGSYTGTATTLQIDCGFTNGARFVMIKRTDSTGDWYVWDSTRGIVAGNDPYFRMNLNSLEVTSTDYIDTASTGFEISSTAPAAINANGGTYIFLAIA